MKCFLRGSLLGLLILGAAPAFAQPLEFRSASEPANASGNSAVSLGLPRARPADPTPAASSPLEFQSASVTGLPFVRAKVQDDKSFPEGGLRIEPIKTMPGKNGDIVAPPMGLNSVPTFVPPPPTMVGPNGAVIQGAPPGVIGGPPAGVIMGDGGTVIDGGMPGGFIDGMSAGGACCGSGSCGMGSCGIGCGGCDSCGCGSIFGCEEYPLLGCLFRCPDECACCMYRPRAWLRGEYLLWHMSQPQGPTLLIGNGPPADPQFNTGNSTVLFGGSDYNSNLSSGGRLSAGFWFPRNPCWGIDGSAFYLGKRNGSYTNAGTSAEGFATGRPFIDAQTGQNTAERVVFPGQLSGQFDVNYYTKLWGFDVNLRHKWACGPRYFVDWFVGYRHLEFDDGIAMQETLRPDVLPGTLFTLRDEFQTRNVFNGGQIGLDGEVRFLTRMFLAGNFKVALGNMNEQVQISGFSTQSGGGLRAGTFPGGLYTSPTNIGTYSVNQFCVIPEFGLKIGVDVTQRLRVFAGYNFMYVSSVMRAAEQIDQTVNLSRLPFFNQGIAPVAGPVRPTVLYKQNDFIAQGFTAGLEYRW